MLLSCGGCLCSLGSNPLLKISKYIISIPHLAFSFLFSYKGSFCLMLFLLRQRLNFVPLNVNIQSYNTILNSVCVCLFVCVGVCWVWVYVCVQTHVTECIWRLEVRGQLLGNDSLLPSCEILGLKLRMSDLCTSDSTYWTIFLRIIS